MAEMSGFFGDNAGDRQYTTDFLADWIHSFIGNGVYNGELGVTPGSSLSIIIPAGRAWINGYYYHNDGPKTITLATADGVLKRKDTVVIRFDINTRNITAQVITGTLASNPTAPAIIRNTEQFDLKIAEISIGVGATQIQLTDITDTRLDSSVCGIVTGIVQQADTSTIFQQYLAWWNAQQNTTGYLTVTGDNPSLNTTSKKIIGAINELLADMITAGSLSSLNTTAKYIVGAINELLADINTAGSLSSLNTTAKYLVGAINELLTYRGTNKTTQTVTGATTLTLSQSGGFVLCGGSGGYTITLPAPSNGAVIPIYNSTGAGITLSAPSGQIKGSCATGTTTTLQMYQMAMLFSDGTNWYFLATPQITGTLSCPTGGVSVSSAVNASEFDCNWGSNVGRLFLGNTYTNYIASDNGACVTNYAGGTLKPIQASAFPVGSSMRWKNNINPFTDEEAKKLLKINIKTFTYKEGTMYDDGDKVHSGVIAEEIIDLFPEIVELDQEGLPASVDYSKLVVPCIGMIQRQQKTIDALTALLVSKGVLTQDEINNL